MKKRGLSHIEIIIAFLLFIFGVFSVMIYLKPFEKPSDLEQLQARLLDRIIEVAEVNLTEYSVLVNEGEVNNPTIAVKLSIPESKNIRVENADGEYLQSSKGNGQVYFDWLPEHGRVIIIKESEVYPLVNNASSTPDYEENLTIITSMYAHKVLSENKLMKLTDSSETDYDALGSALEIPRSNSFSFGVYFSDKEAFESRKLQESKGEERASRGRRKAIIRNDGTLSWGEVRASVW